MRSLRDATDRLAENDRDELAAVTSGAGHDIKAGVANETGLHAVGSREADEQAVMSAHRLLAHFHLDRREEIGVLRKLDDNGAGELGQIAGRGDLAFVGKTIDISEGGAGHAEVLRRLVHARDECLIATGDRLGDHHGDVVGRLHDEHLQRDVEGDRAADWESELVGACAVAFCEQTTLVLGETVPAFSAWKVT